MPLPLICPKAPCSWQPGSLLAWGGMATALLPALQPCRAPGLGKLARPCLLVHGCLVNGTPCWTGGGGGDQRYIQAAMTPGSPDYGFGLKMGKTGFSSNTLETPWNVPVDSRRESLSHHTGQANTLEAFGLPEERNAALKDQGQSGGVFLGGCALLSSISLHG